MSLLKATELTGRTRTALPEIHPAQAKTLEPGSGGWARMGGPTPQAVMSDQKRRLQPSRFLQQTKDSFEFTEYFGTRPGRFFLLRWVGKYF